MQVAEAFEEIMNYAHWWNWVPDWAIVQKIYEQYPDSYSVLTPFAYTYLEELIRTKTSEYGREIYNENGSTKSRKSGQKLIKLAIKENSTNTDFVNLLKSIEEYFYKSKDSDKGDNRHGVAHGYLHPRFWSQESFEKLIIDIARLSRHSGF